MTRGKMSITNKHREPKKKEDTQNIKIYKSKKVETNRKTGKNTHETRRKPWLKKNVRAKESLAHNRYTEYDF